MSGGRVTRCEQDIYKIEQYLPLLENLLFYVDAISTNSQMAPWIAALKIRWSSALSSSSFFNFSGPNFFQIDSLLFELGMTLFLYGAILRKRALEVLSSGVTVRRAEEKGTSPVLLVKLHHGVALFLEEAIGILSKVFRQCRDISSRLSEFISSCKSSRVEKSAISCRTRKVLRKLERENDFVLSARIPSEDELPLPEGMYEFWQIRLLSTYFRKITEELICRNWSFYGNDITIYQDINKSDDKTNMKRLAFPHIKDIFRAAKKVCYRSQVVAVVASA
ncbi:hypothetical protein RIF29_24692 [Crotalaria pallida]|uniref:Uncharacterized protein n=1 Tax=Crotalaria pallida TaxID=3830 RepID=A0AAN9EMP4_CROPI